MTQEEYNWHINLIKERRQIPNLSFEQAEKIYRYEQDKDIYSEKYSFSIWEEWDYESTTFQEILTTEQFNTYLSYLQVAIKQYQQSLSEQDKERPYEILHYEEIIQYYEQHFLPELLRDYSLSFTWLLREKNKIDYLKEEYQRFLNDTKKGIIVQHFRHNRTFKPNELKRSLLQQKAAYILPDYRSFKDQMDEPTKAIAEYLETKVQHLPKNTANLLKTKFTDLQDFISQSFKKHYPENMGGWHVETDEISEKELQKNRAMCLLLVDRKKYDSNTVFLSA